MYLLLGRELEQIEYATAGTVVGITGLEDYVIKSATLSSTYAMPAFTELTLNVTPILRVAVEPHDPRDLPKLRRGLKILNQADPCVQVCINLCSVNGRLDLSSDYFLSKTKQLLETVFHISSFFCLFFLLVMV